jgi:formylglycine-generating enzyme required for sulfatase activity
MAMVQRLVQRSSAQSRVSRGGSWNNSNPDYLLAWCRFSVTPAYRRDGLGFRCVVAVESSQ